MYSSYSVCIKSWHSIIAARVFIKSNSLTLCVESIFPQEVNL